MQNVLLRQRGAMICPSHFPVSGIGRCHRCRSPSLTSRSLARMRSRRDFLLIFASPVLFALEAPREQAEQTQRYVVHPKQT